jgi:hypothetical protein
MIILHFMVAVKADLLHHHQIMLVLHKLLLLVT